MEHTNDNQPELSQQGEESTVRGQDAATDDELLKKLLKKIEQKKLREPALPKLVRPTASLQGIQLLGRGGLGYVYRYRDRALDRDLALKVARHHILSSSTGIARFIRERRITAKLNHPSIPPVHHSGTLSDGRPYYVMRLIRGKSLSLLLKQRKASPKDFRRNQRLTRLLDAFERICDAVQYAHEAGVIHRDIKPANIVLEKHGAAFLVDWGLAREMFAQQVAGEALESPESSTASLQPSPNLTQIAHQIGSPDYMSPEQAEGRIEAHGPATDVYGLGATLFQLLTGVAPHAATRPAHEESREQMFARIAQTPPPSADTLVPHLPAALASICLRAMQCNPSDRYRSAREIRLDLQRWRKDEVVHAHATRYTLLQRAQLFISRHQSLVSIIAGGTAIVLLVTIAAAAVVAEKNVRLDTANRALDEKAKALKTASSDLDQRIEELNLAKLKLKEEKDRLELSLQIGFKMLRGIETEQYRSLDDAYVDIFQNGLQMPNDERAAMLPLYQALISMQKASELVSPGTSESGVSGFFQGVSSKFKAGSEAAIALNSLNASIDASDRIGLAWLLRAQIKSEFLGHSAVSVLDDWNHAVNLLPNCSAAFSGRGWCQLQMKEREPAAVDFIRAIELDPNNEYARYGLGKIRVLEKNYNEALEHLHAALKQTPRYSTNPNWKELLYEWLTNAHWGRGHLTYQDNGAATDVFEDLCLALQFGTAEERVELWRQLAIAVGALESDISFRDRIRNITPMIKADATSESFTTAREFVAFLADVRTDAIDPEAVELMMERLRDKGGSLTLEISSSLVKTARNLVDDQKISPEASKVISPLLDLLEQL